MLLWGADDRLDERSRERLESGPGPVFVSEATIWELEIKLASGRLRSPGDFEWLVGDAGYEQLAISFAHAKTAARLPLHHSDPFDRMLIAQAQIEGLTLATADQELERYEVPILAVRPLPA